MRPETVVHEARFHENVRRYLYLSGFVTLTVTIVGIPLVPFWIFVGRWWSRRYYERLGCVLGARALVVKKGIQFRTEKTIPLDKIQDVSVRHGPLLDWLGLTKLVIETAGQGAQGAAANLTGIVDALDFRDRILGQRDRLAGSEGAGSGASSAGPAAGVGEGGSGSDAGVGAADPRVIALLEEIRDVLRGLEGGASGG